MADSAFKLASSLKFDSKKQDIHFWVAFYWFLNKNCWGRSVCRGVHFSQGVCHPGYDCAEVRNHFWYVIHSPVNKTLVYFQLLCFDRKIKKEEYGSITFGSVKLASIIQSCFAQVRRLCIPRGFYNASKALPRLFFLFLSAFLLFGKHN